jgi:hypothetical protein
MAKKMKVVNSLPLYVDLEISETLLVWANEKVRLSG